MIGFHRHSAAAVGVLVGHLENGGLAHEESHLTSQCLSAYWYVRALAHPCTPNTSLISCPTRSIAAIRHYDF